MSVFQVTLNNNQQGGLDFDPSTASQGALGDQMAPSIQRTIYVTGPNRTYRKLNDGDTFTDCNYWKRFAYPQVDLADAFITVTTDDGSVYSDVAEENTFPVVYDLTLDPESGYDDNVADILTDHGGAAVFVQIANTGAEACKVRLNGIATAIFDLAASETQVFNNGDLSVTMLEFLNDDAATETSVQVLCSVRSVCNS